MRIRTFSERYAYRRDILGRGNSSTITKVNKDFHDEEEAPRYRDRWGHHFDERTVADVLRALKECTGHPVGDLGRVLDLGAGDGLMIWAVTKAGKATFPVAQDISGEMLKQMPPPENPGHMRIRPVQSDACLLPFRSNSFDTVIANAIFHHVPSPLRTAGEVLRVLAPEGQLLVSGEPTAFCNALQGAIKLVPIALLDALRFLLRKPIPEVRRMAKQCPPDVYAFPPAELSQCMHGAGFGRVRLETVGFASLLFRIVVRPWLVFLLRQKTGHAVEEKIYRWLAKLDREVLDRLLPSTLKVSVRLRATKPRAISQPRQRRKLKANGPMRK